MKWYECSECAEEFRVITESVTPITYCPLCGSDLEETVDEDEEYEDE
jgi:predicted nucleic acid-binding Zn ribbon protein